MKSTGLEFYLVHPVNPVKKILFVTTQVPARGGRVPE
jgi:hypothetical protein